MVTRVTIRQVTNFKALKTARHNPILQPRSACLLLRPLTRLRHIRKLLGLISARMILITSPSTNPVCAAIASNDVASSHAIATISDAVTAPGSGRGVAGMKSSGKVRGGVLAGVSVMAFLRLNKGIDV